MRLILFEVFGIKVYSYGFFIAVGILVAASLFINKAKKEGYKEDNLLNLILFAVISGVLGGKLLFIIVEFKKILKDPSILLDFGNGFVIYGAIIMGVLSIWIYCRRNNWNTLEILDYVVPGVALAQGFGRIGCFLAGCCYGKETTMKIGVEFPIDSLAPSGIHLHPTQIYSSIFDFLLGIFLIWYSSKSKKTGRVCAMYVIIYSIGRFLVEFLRNDPRGNIGTLSTSQFIAIFTFVIGILIYNIDKIRREDNDSEKA